MKPPQHKHDCDQCVYLAHIDDYDVYHCKKLGIMPTIIARYGDNGPQYASTPESITQKWDYDEIIKCDGPMLAVWIGWAIVECKKQQEKKNG